MGHDCGGWEVGDEGDEVVWPISRTWGAAREQLAHRPGDAHAKFLSKSGVPGSIPRIYSDIRHELTL
jgi:hypothetical protein